MAIRSWFLHGANRSEIARLLPSSVGKNQTVVAIGMLAYQQRAGLRLEASRMSNDMTGDQRYPAGLKPEATEEALNDTPILLRRVQILDNAPFILLIDLTG